MKKLNGFLTHPLTVFFVLALSLSTTVVWFDQKSCYRWGELKGYDVIHDTFVGCVVVGIVDKN